MTGADQGEISGWSLSPQPIKNMISFLFGSAYFFDFGGCVLEGKELGMRGMVLGWECGGSGRNCVGSLSGQVLGRGHFLCF